MCGHGLCEHFLTGPGNECFLLFRKLLLCEEDVELFEVIDSTDVLLERGGLLFARGDHPDLEVKEPLPDRGKGSCVDAFAVLPREAVERDLRKRELLGLLFLYPENDLFGDLCRVPPGAGDRAAVVHRRFREVEVPDLVPARVYDKSALGVAYLAVREELGRARVPGVTCDLRLVVVVAERNVIKSIGEDRAVELVLCNGGKPLVFYLRGKPVGDEHVVLVLCQVYRVKGRAVILGPEHVGEERKERVADLDLLGLEGIRGVDLGHVVPEHRERRGGVPGLGHAVVAGHDHERDSCIVEPGQGIERCRIGPGLGLYRVKKVAGMDKHIRPFSDDDVNRSKEVLIDLPLPHVHPGLRVEPGACGKAEVRVCDMDDLHCV